MTSSAQHKKEVVGILLKVVSVMESKRPYAVGHCRRVAEMARRTAESLGMGPGECGVVYLAGLLHDIGYLSLPDDLFQSSEPLTPQQREMVESQLQVGLQILDSSSVLTPVCQVLRFLRHRFQDPDGTQDCQGEEIPLGSRILQVAEVFDALTSPRPYRRRFSIKEALAEMEGDPGRFDPRVLEVFRQTMRLEIDEKGRSAQELQEFQERLDRLCQQVKSGKIAVPTVSKAGPIIEQMLRDEEADLKQTSRVIELEPSLALKIIATANSSLFYGMSHVSSVADALVRLGLREARNLLLTYMFRSLFKAKQMIFRNAVEAWWEHSLLTATACQSLSPRCGQAGRDYAYLLGLMHDIGKPCLLQALLRELDKKQFTEECLDLIFASISSHHSRVGALVLRRANFPPSFIKALDYRRRPELAKQNPDALLLVLAHEIVRQVRSEPDRSPVNLEELLPECRMDITVEDIRRAVSTTIHRYQGLQSLLAAQEEEGMK